MPQASDPKYMSKYFKQKKIHVLASLSQSPDLNSIEMWHDLKRAVHARILRNINELKEFCKEEWSKIPSNHCTSLINSYRKHLVEIIAAKEVLPVIRFT
uniref:DDE-1 domain-containing protein n=1 Tax=Anguilla anguilla TaxID=7936 RepID=A0A0E9WWT3_ANGAN